jgi:tRNA(Leu) C34 or U34 (ribose-2'-O)-methylase TrmL
VEQRGAYRIPLWGPVRSLNLSNAVAVATYAALQKVSPERFA